MQFQVCIGKSTLSLVLTHPHTTGTLFTCYLPIQTANTAAFALYHLSKYPEVQEEARKEVLSVVGRDGYIDDAALQKMPFIKACFKETTRCVCVRASVRA